MASGRTCPLSKSVYEEAPGEERIGTAGLGLASGTKESAARNANATKAMSDIIKPRRERCGPMKIPSSF